MRELTQGKHMRRGAQVNDDRMRAHQANPVKLQKKSVDIRELVNTGHTSRRSTDQLREHGSRVKRAGTQAERPQCLKLQQSVQKHACIIRIGHEMKWAREYEIIARGMNNNTNHETPTAQVCGPAAREVAKGKLCKSTRGDATEPKTE